MGGWQSALPWPVRPPKREVQTYALVDVIAGGAGLSKSKARKAIQGGMVTIDKVVVYDPDMRVPEGTAVEYTPRQ